LIEKDKTNLKRGNKVMGFPTGPETDNFPIIKARWFKDIVNQKREVRVIVIHSMEAPEKGTTAENVARLFQSLPSNRKASAHLCIDNNSIVQCVLDNDVAFAAPGANHNGIQLELAGFARQTRAEWLDEYGKTLLENAANAVSQYCLKYNIPRKHLTNDQLRNGDEGIIGHVQASEVFKKSDHTDPGKGFPWDYFIERVEHYYTERKQKFAKPT
jgi:N-acetyl-anhydromuramyl-L-alanine amidase AmpD